VPACGLPTRLSNTSNPFRPQPCPILAGRFSGNAPLAISPDW
jgi:hypothetical protein